MNDADFNRALGALERNQELQAEMGDEGDDESTMRDPKYCRGCTRRNCGECPV